MVGDKKGTANGGKVGEQIKNANYPLPITHYLLPITYYPLPITHYLLPITYYPLPTSRVRLESIRIFAQYPKHDEV